MCPVNLSIAYQAKGIPTVKSLMNKCQNCNKETLNPKYCSKSCSAISTNKQNPRRKRVKNCKTCNVLILSSRTYCSPKCYPKRNRKALAGYSNIKRYRHKVKLEAIKYKGGCCKICNYSKCINALEFHHLDPNEKEFTLSQGIKSWNRVKIELDKCILLCANCHREVHAGLVTLPAE